MPRPSSYVFSLLRRLRYRRPALAARALAPQTVEAFEGALSIEVLFGKQAAYHDARAPDACAAVHVNAPTLAECRLNGRLQLLHLRRIIRYVGVGDGAAQVNGVFGQ
jgi:hypothetical protein